MKKKLCMTSEKKYKYAYEKDLFIKFIMIFIFK